uniref:Transposase n=1 Tax=Meloidogyne incognita TaxID=6306 RepID=A0A914MMI8_MELIC
MEFLTDISKQMITDWMNFFRDICAEHFIRNPVQVGGEGVLVEVDETVVVRRKYERGRVPGTKDVWLLYKQI